MTPDNRLVSERFPRSSKYHPEWVMASASGGANALCLTEWLAASLDLRPGMRVRDLGCGRAASSIFLHREFGVQVWATDLWFSVSETRPNQALHRTAALHVGGQSGILAGALKRVARATRPLRSATRRPELPRATLRKGRVHWLELSLPC